MPTNTRPKADARLLAALAEWADGIREKELSLVLTKEDTYVLKEQNEIGPDDEVILEVFTGARRRGGLKPTTIVVGSGQGSVEVQRTLDALFWTESAIEKFLFPYYYSQRLLDEDQMQRLKDSFLPENVVALGHTPPTHPKALRAGSVPITVLDMVRTQDEGGGAISGRSLDDYLQSIKT